MTPTEEDAELTESAAQAFADSTEAQFLASLLEHLRDAPRPWWSAEQAHAWWPTDERFRWFSHRPDLRATVTHGLTGFAAGAARATDGALQAELVERVLASGDISVDAWDDAFSTADLAVHGPRDVIWGQFRSAFPWDAPQAEDRALLVWLFERLLVDDGREPILTALYLRSAIDVRVWQEHVPLDLRVKVDARRLRRELEGEAFTCEDELTIVGLSKVVEHVPLDHLQGILDAVERVLGGLAPRGELPLPLDDADFIDVDHIEAIDEEDDDLTELREDLVS